FGVHTHLQCRTIEWMFFAEELAKLANLGILDHDGSLLGLRGNHIVNRQARGGGNSNCRWAGILIVADHQEPNWQEAGHPGTFPNRPERNAAGPASSPNRAAEGRGTWRPGVLQPEERGPASLLRADSHSCLPPLAGAGPTFWHRLGRLARSRAATRGLGMRGLAA